MTDATEGVDHQAAPVELREARRQPVRDREPQAAQQTDVERGVLEPGEAEWGGV